MPRDVTLGPRFRDGLGVRVVEVDQTSGDTVEVLQLCPELCAFEKSIKDRTDRLSTFRHPRFVPVRGVQSVSSPHRCFGIVADHIVGPRLSEVLEAARSQKVAVDTNAALHLIRELLSAISVLHESRKVTHGAIAPERLIVTPRGRLVIADYTLGLALERLQYNRARLWRDFRIAMPPTAGAARFDQRADVVQIGTLAVALLLGRQLDTSDYTNRLKLLLDEAFELTVHGDRKLLSSGLRSWLERALPLEARRPFATAQQANVALEQILIKERRLSAAPAALKALISRYLAHTGGRAAETQEPATDRPAQPSIEVATAVESLPSTEVLRPAAPRLEAPLPRDEVRAPQLQNVQVSLPVNLRRDEPSLTSAVMEADPEVEGPFAAIPFEIVPEIVPEIVSRIIPETPSETTLGVASEIGSEITVGVASKIGSEITVEVASGTDAEFTVEVASAIIPETTLEIVPETTLETIPEAALETTSESSPGVTFEIARRIGSEIGQVGAPEVAASDAAESWAPAADPVSPSAEVPGVTGFDADPVRILALEEQLGVEPKPHQLPTEEAEISAALETPAPQIGAVTLSLRDEPTTPGSLPADLAPESRHEATRERPCEPVPEAASDDLWVIDPSDLTFDPAFLDGLYLAPNVSLGPLTPRVPPLAHADKAVAPKEPLTAEAAVTPGDAQPATSVAAVPGPLGASPALGTTAVAAADQAAACEEPVAAEAAADEPPAASAPVPEPLEVLPAPEATWPAIQEVLAPAAEAVAKSIADAAATPVTEVVAESVAAPVAEAIAPERSLDGTAPPGASVAPVPEPLEVLPALEATWPFVQESPAPVAEAVAKLASEPLSAPVAEVLAESVAAPIAEAIAPDKPLDGAAPPAASVAPVPEPLEVLPALEATWPFVQESPALVVEEVAKLVSRSVAESVAAPVAEAIAPDKPLDVAAPTAGKECPPAEVESDALGPQTPAPHADVPVLEDSGIQEAVEVFERLLDSLKEAQATSTPDAFPGLVGTPSHVVTESPGGAEKAVALSETGMQDLPPARPGEAPAVAEAPAPPAESIDAAVPAEGRGLIQAPASKSAQLDVPAVTRETEPLRQRPGRSHPRRRLWSSAQPVTPALPPEARRPEPERPTWSDTDKVLVPDEVLELPGVPILAQSEASTLTPQDSREGAEATLVEVGSLAPAALSETGMQDLPPARPGEAPAVAEAPAPPAESIDAAVPAEGRGLIQAPASKSAQLDVPAVTRETEPRQRPGRSHPRRRLWSSAQPVTPALPPEARRPEPERPTWSDADKVLAPPAAPAVIPPPAAALPTLGTASAPAATMAASPRDQAPAHGQISGSPSARVLTFEPAPIGSGPTVFTPTGETPLAPTPARVPTFSVRKNAARLARAVPRRLIELGRTPVRWRQTAAAALILVALGGVRLATAYWFKAPPPTGGLIVETVPDGLDIFIDNTLRGRTPMSLALLAGDHVLELRGRGLTRTLPVRIVPGVQAEERLSWPLSVRTGRLRVESEPARATVSIDGEARGVTPLTIEDLTARDHTLVVQGKGGRVEQTVAIEPERTTTVKVPVFPGWMKVFSPFDLQIFEGGRLLGSSDVDRIMLRAGRHTIEFVNEELGYRVARQVNITPGDLAPVSIELPNGTLQVDAPPGFEVWLDGERVGETPLAPLEVSLGTHEVRLKHPEAGERRQVVVVTQRGPARVAAEGR